MNKTVLILGASSVIGRLIVDKFLLSGWNVLAYCNINNPFVEKKYLLHNIKVVSLDLENASSVEEHLANVNFLDVSSFINCAGKITPTKFSDCSYHSLIDVLAINVISPNLFIQKLLPIMKNNNFGRIVNFGSIGVDFGGGINNYAYSLSKHMLEFFPQEIRKAAKNNVLCNNLKVGFVNTGAHKKIPGKSYSNRVSLIPAKRAANPEEIVEITFHLGSEINTYITNQVISISGGE